MIPMTMVIHIWMTVDNCPFNTNEDQADADTDGIGDVCDPDRDGDLELQMDG